MQVTRAAGAARMGRVLSVTMNDRAIRLLGVLDGFASLDLPGALHDELRDSLAIGIARRGDVVTWADSTWDPDRAPSGFPDLTYWEVQASSFHLERFTPATVVVTDHQPWISEADQRVVLLHGIAFAREFVPLVYRLDPPTAVRCIVGVNETNGTFRFHMIRPGESWTVPDLDSYRQDHMVVLDIEPDGTQPPEPPRPGPPRLVYPH
jgi:hypothetical protein